MLLINAVNTEGHPLEIYIRDGKIAAVGQDLGARWPVRARPSSMQAA